MINRFQIRAFFLALYVIVFVVGGSAQSRIAPAYPLITHDPYFSVWSFTDSLNASPTRHWTGTEQPLTGYLKVDNVIYQFMGSEGKAYDNILPAAEDGDYQVKYTETKPAGDWQLGGFNDAQWKTGNGPFGTDASWAKTSWRSKDLWVRRTFNFNGSNEQPVFLKINHDDNIEVYLNGTRVYHKVGWVNKYILLPIEKELLKKGSNILAIYIKNTAGGQHLDFGLVAEKIPLHKKAVKKPFRRK